MRTVWRRLRSWSSLSIPYATYWQTTPRAHLRQLRDPLAGDNIGMALTEALYHAIETELDREQRPAHHFVNFAITAHGFTHAYQTANFTVGEFLQRTARLDEMLATLAGKLNSNESFNPDLSF